VGYAEVARSIARVRTALDQNSATSRTFAALPHTALPEAMARGHALLDQLELQLKVVLLHPLRCLLPLLNYKLYRREWLDLWREAERIRVCAAHA
jgi:hypothetical protein